MDENATLIERIYEYANNGNDAQARALCQVADFLEECYLWDVSFDGPKD